MANPETNFLPATACDAKVLKECSGFRSLTPPAKVMSSLVIMQTCGPCGGVEVEARRTDGEHDPHEAALAVVWENCGRRKKQVEDVVNKFPWMKPAESGAEQLEAWRTARDIICLRREMLGVVAGTLWVAQQQGGLDMQPAVSSQTVAKLPIDNSQAQKMHLILLQHGLVNTHQDPKTRVCSFTILDDPVWLEFGLMPEVRILVDDLRARDEYRSYPPGAKNDYLELVNRLRRGQPE